MATFELMMAVMEVMLLATGGRALTRTATIYIRWKMWEEGGISGKLEIIKKTLLAARDGEARAKGQRLI